MKIATRQAGGERTAEDRRRYLSGVDIFRRVRGYGTNDRELSKLLPLYLTGAEMTFMSIQHRQRRMPLGFSRGRGRRRRTQDGRTPADAKRTQDAATSPKARQCGGKAAGIGREADGPRVRRARGRLGGKRGCENITQA